jgi:probable O-glycosylation ligase (exosortase A-associated)
MKHLLLMIALTLAGTVGALAVSPFWGVAVYYLFAVLRPQFIWEWDLPRGISWSFYVAVATLAAVAAGRLGLIRTLQTPGEEQGARPALSGAHYLVIGFGAWVCLTYFTARNLEQSYRFLIEFLKIFVMFAASAVVIRTVRQVWFLFVLTTVALAYIAYEINYIYLFQGRYNYIYENGYGGFDNNGAALLLAMGVPLCYFSWEGTRGWRRWAFLAPIPLLIHAVLMSYSRGAMVSLLASIPVFLLRSRRRIQLSLILLVVALLIPVMAGQGIRERFFTLERTEVDESANERWASWGAAWNIALENPILGVGMRNADLLSYSYGADREGRTIHSQYLQTAADSGFVALALYLGALAAFWLSTGRARRAAAGRDDPESVRVRAVAAGVETSMVVFCVGAAFLSLENMELPYLLLLLGAQLPLVYRALPRPEPGPAGEEGVELEARHEGAPASRGRA